MIDFQDSIKNVLLTLTADHRMKPTKNLLLAWEKGLYGIDVNILNKGLDTILQKERKFMPTVGEFRKVCEDLKTQKIIDERRLTKEEPVVPLDKKEAKQAYQNITSKLKTQITPNERPSLLLYDYLDNDANIIRIQCKHHVDFELFKSQCILVHKRAPSKIYHKWQLWKKIVKTDPKGKLGRPYHAHVICDPHTKGAEPITVGYYQLY